jgi:hypothetical protein
LAYTSSSQLQFQPNAHRFDLSVEAYERKAPVRSDELIALETSLLNVLRLEEPAFNHASGDVSWWVDSPSGRPWCLTTSSTRLDLHRGILVASHVTEQMHQRIPLVPITEVAFDTRVRNTRLFGAEEANADEVRNCITFAASRFDPVVLVMNPSTPKLAMIRGRNRGADYFDIKTSDTAVHEFAHLALKHAAAIDHEAVALATETALCELGASLPAWWVLGNWQGATVRTHVALWRSVSNYATHDVHEAMAEMASVAELAPRPHIAVTNWWNTIIELVGGDPSQPKLSEIEDA